ncbi:MAG TPA: uroporphyrinogen-III C-methyltransferase [Myxococcota bacterium]
MSRRGRVLLVGAGPGDPDLITVRGAEALRRADVVVYDALVARELLALAPPGAELVDVGKRGHEEPTRSQAEINALLVERARAGRVVVRLKGGDPFVYGRGGEEASACRAAGVPFEVIPGVTSALAAPAYAGIPVTDRRHGASFAVVTGHRDAARPWTSIAWQKLATAVDTLVVLMGMRNLEKIAETLIAAGRAADTPCAVVMEAATARQRVVTAPLAEIARRAREAGFASPAVVVVGDVVRLRDEIAWFEHAPLFGRRVLVTRPAEQADELCALLRAAGAEPVAVPMLRIVATPQGEGVAAALEALAGYDALLFTSANAPRCFAAALAAAGRDPAQAPPAHCVGPATAAAARHAGFAPAEGPAERFDAEALLALLRPRAAGRRFLFVRGEPAGSRLASGLRAAGARVDEAVVYRSEPAEVDADALRAMLVRGALDALTFTSGAAVRRFASLLDEPARRAARTCQVAAIGEPTAAALRAEGLPVDAVAERAGARELVEALAEACARKGDPG